MHCVFLFPGQGVQYVGMGKDIYAHYKSVQELFEVCSDITKQDMAHLLFETDEGTLKKTENSQIAMTLMSVSVAKALEEKGVRPSAVAGFSLGEYAALVVAGVVALEDVFTLVAIRGTIMEEVSEKLNAQFSSEGNVGMTAIVGLSPQDIQHHIETSGIENIYLSMYNSPVQGVVGGPEKARAGFVEFLRDKAKIRAVPLKVSGPFHTPLMEEARERFSEAIMPFVFRDPHPNVQIYSNVHGKQVNTGTELKMLCIEQLVHPVQWIDEEHNIMKTQPNSILEVGAGKVLTNLLHAWKKANVDEEYCDCTPINTLEDVQQLEV